MASPNNDDLVYQEFETRARTPVSNHSLPTASPAVAPPRTNTSDSDDFDTFEEFDKNLVIPSPSLVERPSFHDASEEEHVTPHTTTDDF